MRNGAELHLTLYTSNNDKCEKEFRGKANRSTIKSEIHPSPAEDHGELGGLSTEARGGGMP